MKKKKTEIKQKQKQTVNITIGDRVVKRRRGRPRKARPAPSPAIGGGFTPIINYPPNYVNPSVLQPLQKPQGNLLVPKPPPVQEDVKAIAEGATASALGASTNPVKLQLEKPELLNLIPSAERLTTKAEEVRLARLQKFQGLKSTEAKPTFASTADNALGGLDQNLGQAVEPEYNASEIFEPPSPAASTLSGYSLQPGDLSAYRKEFVPKYSKLSQELPLPPIAPLPSSGLSSSTYPEFGFQEGEAGFVFKEGGAEPSEKKKKKKLVVVTDLPPYVPATQEQLFPRLADEPPPVSRGPGRPRKIREGDPGFSGPSLERQRNVGITPKEETFLSSP